MLVVGVGQQGVPGTEVHGGDPRGGEAGDVGPPVLGLRLPAHRGDQLPGQRGIQPGPGRGGEVRELQGVPGEQLPHVLLSLLQGLVRGEAVVDVHPGGIRDDVAGHPALDLHGVETLAVVQVLHGHGGRAVLLQDPQGRAQPVDRVHALPGAPGVGGHALGAQPEPQGPVAPALDGPVGGLQQHREVRVIHQPGLLPQQPAQAGGLRGHLLVVVEHVGDVPARRGQGGGQGQLHRDPALHVRGPAPVQDPLPVGLLPPGGHGAAGPGGRGQRDGVQVPGQHHPLGPAQLGAGHDRIIVAMHPQVAQRREGRVDRVGDRRLLPGDGGDVQQGAGQFGDVAGQVQGGGCAGGIVHGSTLGGTAGGQGRLTGLTCPHP